MRSQFWKILDHLDSRKLWIYPILQIIVELMNAFLIVANASIGDLKDVAILGDPKDVQARAQVLSLRCKHCLGSMKTCEACCNALQPSEIS